MPPWRSPGQQRATLAADGDSNVHQVAAAGLAAAELSALTAPSLFGGGCVLVVQGTQDAGKDLSAELVSLARLPVPQVFLVVTHSGGAREKWDCSRICSAQTPGELTARP